MIRRIFVFGSNIHGMHGAGAAVDAVEYWGAIMGQGKGLQGDSYGIPTMLLKGVGRQRPNIPLRDIQWDCIEFIKFAKEHPELQFHVTAIGTGLAGWTISQIAPFFKDVPDNVFVCDSFYLYNLENQ